MPGQLSEAEIQQRRDAARKRWADRAMTAVGVVAPFVAAYEAPKAFLGTRAPTAKEARAAYKKQAVSEVKLLLREGYPKPNVLRAVAAQRAERMGEVLGQLRPIGNRRAQIASAVAGGLLVNGMAQTDEKEATAAARWGLQGLALGAALRSIPAVERRLPRAAIAAGAAGMAAYGAHRAQQKRKAGCRACSVSRPGRLPQHSEVARDA